MRGMGGKMRDGLTVTLEMVEGSATGQIVPGSLSVLEA
jgi:hypothetical protein